MQCRSPSRGRTGVARQNGSSGTMNFCSSWKYPCLELLYFRGIWLDSKDELNDLIHLLLQLQSEVRPSCFLLIPDLFFGLFANFCEFLRRRRSLQRQELSKLLNAVILRSPSHALRRFVALMRTGCTVALGLSYFLDMHQYRNMFCATAMRRLLISGDEARIIPTLNPHDHQSIGILLFFHAT